MSKNRKLKDFLAGIEKLAKSGLGREGIKQIFSCLKEFRQTNGEIKFDHSVKWMIAAAFVLISCIFAWQYFNSWELQDVIGGYIIAVVIVLAAGIITPIALAFSDSSSIDSISDAIFNTDILLDNNFQILDVNGKEKELYEDFKGRFGDFARGDEDQEITSLIKGTLETEGNKLDHDYYTFRYVRVYYVNVPVTVGKSTVMVPQKRTETLYRFGIIMKFGLSKNIAVVSSDSSFGYADTWSTDSKEFNDIFSVHTDDRHVAAKFLKPAVILAFVDIAKDFDGLNVEINEKGELNISFSETVVFCLERKYSIAETEEFEKEIDSHRELARHQKLTQFVGVLYKHNDSNF